ncbi:MAG: DUF3276 family protein [Bacteroidaceae bacterium]
MSEYKKKNSFDGNEKDIVFSRDVRAGKRIYYLDVKKNRKEEMYLAITESKKVISGMGNDAQISFEKHKIFLYQEDLEKFQTTLQEVINYINKEKGDTEEEDDDENSLFKPNDEMDSAFIESSKIDLDIDF